MYVICLFAVEVYFQVCNATSLRRPLAGWINLALILQLGTCPCVATSNTTFIFAIPIELNRLRNTYWLH
jgi:hypothetical protein